MKIGPFLCRFICAPIIPRLNGTPILLYTLFFSFLFFCEIPFLYFFFQGNWACKFVLPDEPKTPTELASTRRTQRSPTTTQSQSMKAISPRPLNSREAHKLKRRNASSNGPRKQQPHLVLDFVEHSEKRFCSNQTKKRGPGGGPYCFSLRESKPTSPGREKNPRILAHARKSHASW